MADTTTPRTTAKRVGKSKTRKPSSRRDPRVYVSNFLFINIDVQVFGQKLLPKQFSTPHQAQSLSRVSVNPKINQIIRNFFAYSM